MNIEVLALILANVLISYQGFNDYSFFEKYKFWTQKIQQGQYIRLISGGFLHANWQHLIFNMITLFFFGPIVVSEAGGVVFFGIYFLSLLCGNLFSLYIYRNHPFYTAVGASGATIGILYSSVLFHPEMKILLFFIPIPAYLFGIGYLLYSIYGMKKLNDSIGHTAHLGGAVCGYLATLLIYPEFLYTETLLVILLAVPIALLIILIYRD